MSDTYIFIIGFGIFVTVVLGISLMMTVTYQIATEEAETNRISEKIKTLKL